MALPPPSTPGSNGLNGWTPGVAPASLMVAVPEDVPAPSVRTVPIVDPNVEIVDLGLGDRGGANGLINDTPANGGNDDEPSPRFPIWLLPVGAVSAAVVLALLFTRKPKPPAG